MAEASGAKTYNGAAIALHWLIAAAILFQLTWDWHEAPESLHISVGLSILALTVLRLALRLLSRPPPPPESLAGWEKLVSKTVHVLFYALMLALPLSGWAMESVDGTGVRFWGVGLPPLPVGAGLGEDAADDLEDSLEEVHGEFLAWAMILLFWLHAAAAIKHQFDGRPVLYRMAPFLKPR